MIYGKKNLSNLTETNHGQAFSTKFKKKHEFYLAFVVAIVLLFYCTIFNCNLSVNFQWVGDLWLGIKSDRKSFRSVLKLELWVFIYFAHRKLEVVQSTQLIAITFPTTTTTCCIKKGFPTRHYIIWREIQTELVMGRVYLIGQMGWAGCSNFEHILTIIIRSNG